MAVLLLSSASTSIATAQVHPSTLPDNFLGVYPTTVDRINCDMLKTGSAATDLLYVIAWDDKSTGDAYIYISDGTNSDQVTVSGAAKPDVVLGVSTSGNYRIGVAYESGTDVYVRSYPVTTGSGVSIGSPTAVGPLNTNAAGEPHIDLWLDNTNKPNGYPSMYEFAAAWHEWNGSTQYEVNAIYGNLNTMVYSSASNPVALDGKHSDISAFDDIVNGRFFALTYTDNAGNNLYEGEYDVANSTFVPVNLQTGADIYNPRIECPAVVNMSSAPGGPDYAVVASVDDYSNPRKIVAYNDNFVPINWSAVLGNTYAHHMPAICANAGELYAPAGGFPYSVAFYPSGDSSLYCNNMDMPFGNPSGGHLYEVNAGSLSITGMPAVAVSSCSNWGYHSFVAYFDGNDIGYKITQASNYQQFKTTGISELAVNEIGLYPNPANNALYLKGIAEANYCIVDMTGRQLLSGKVNGGGAIDISSLSSGLYMVQLTSNGQTQTLKFTKQ